MKITKPKEKRNSMADQEKLKKLGSFLGEKLDQATNKISNAVENFDKEEFKENVSSFSKKVVDTATQKYDEAVGEDKYCAICGKKLGLIAKRKIADGTMCKECSLKYDQMVKEKNLILNKITSTELIELKKDYDIIKKKQTKKVLIMAAAAWVVLMGLLGVMALKENKEHENQIDVSEIKYSLSTDNYESIKNKFSEAGFTNFELVEINDLPENKKSDVGKVEKIEINGDSNIRKIEWVDKESKVTIYYHTLAPAEENSNNSSNSSSSSSS